MKSIYAYLFSWLGAPTRVVELTVAAPTAPQSDRQSKIEIGQYNERLVSNELSKLDPRYYRVLNNIMLPSSDGNTSFAQIDHIILSIYGIFCLETKGYSGSIFGDNNENDWTIVYPGNEYTQPNPVSQNHKHKMAIIKLLGRHNLKARINAFIIFPSAKRITVQNTDAVGDLSTSMLKLSGYSNIVYSMAEVHDLTNKLKLANITDKARREQHSREIALLAIFPKSNVSEYAH